MNCKNCGAINNMGSKFCIKCGQSLDNLTSMQSNIEQPVQQPTIPTQTVDNMSTKNINSFQTVVSGLIGIMQQTYEEQFKHFKVITEEGTDKYSVTFKITNNYYEALSNSINLGGDDKYIIAKSIQVYGFTCKFE